MNFILFFSPSRRLLVLAVRRALIEISVARYSAGRGLFLARAIIKQPEPVPRSIILGFFIFLINFRACSTNNSLSGRGINTFLLTRNFSP